MDDELRRNARSLLSSLRASVSDSPRASAALFQLSFLLSKRSPTSLEERLGASALRAIVVAVADAALLIATPVVSRAAASVVRAVCADTPESDAVPRAVLAARLAAVSAASTIAVARTRAEIAAAALANAVTSGTASAALALALARALARLDAASLGASSRIVRRERASARAAAAAAVTSALVLGGDMWVTIALGSGSGLNDFDRAALVGCISMSFRDFEETAKSDTIARVRAVALSALVASISGGSAAASMSSWAFALSAEGARAHVCDALARSAKLRPAATLAAASALFCSSEIMCTADVDEDSTSALVPITISAAAGTADDTRTPAANAAHAIAFAGPLSGAGAASALVTSAVDILTTKRATVPTWGARAGLASVISAVGRGLCSRTCVVARGASGSAVVVTDAASSLAATTVRSLFSLSILEAHESARVALVSAAIAWLPLACAGGSVPSEVSSALSAALAKSPDDGLTDALRVASDTFAPDANPLTASLSRALAHDSAIVDALATSLSRTVSSALPKTSLPPPKTASASGKGAASTTSPPPAHVNSAVLAPAAAALALIVSLAAAHPTSVASTTADDARFSAAGAPPSGGASAATSKGAATAAAAKSSAKVTVSAADSAAPAPKFSAWDLIASSSAVSGAPGIIGMQGRSHEESLAAAPAALAVLAAIQSLLCTRESVAAAALGGEKALAALAGTSAIALSSTSDGGASEDATGALQFVDPVAAARAEEDADISATTGGVAVSDVAAVKKAPSPTALASALSALLTHPISTVRARAYAVIAHAYRAQSFSMPHSGLAAPLLFAVWDRARVVEYVPPPISRATANDVGLGHGPSAAADARARSADTPKSNLVGDAANADAGADAALSAHAPPSVFSAAILAVLAPSLSAPSPLAHFSAAALLLPAALLAIAHPAVSGLPANDGKGGCAAVPPSQTAGRHGRAARATWRKLLSVAAHAAASDDDKSRAAAAAAVRAAGADAPLHATRTDALFSSLPFRAALAHVLLGRDGVWGVSPARRLGARRAAAIAFEGLCRGGGEGSGKVGSWPGEGAGARAALILDILPVALRALDAVAAARVSAWDAAVWAAPRGLSLIGPTAASALRTAASSIVCAVTGSVPVNDDDTAIDGETRAAAALRNKLDTATSRRYLTLSSGVEADGGGGGADDAADAALDTWSAGYVAELEAARLTAASATAMRAALDYQKSRGGGAFKGAIMLDGAVGGGGGVGGRGNMKTTGASSGASKGADDASIAVAGAAAIRSRVDRVYSVGVAALGLIHALLVSSPRAAQPLLPQLAPFLSRAAACPILGPHAQLVLCAALRSGAADTVVARASAYSLSLWSRALANCAAADSAALAGAVALNPTLVAAALAEVSPLILARRVSEEYYAASGSADGSPKSPSDDSNDDRAVHTTVTAPLPPAVFPLLLPILGAVAGAVPPLPCLHLAVTLLGKHVALPTAIIEDTRPHFAGTPRSTGPASQLPTPLVSIALSAANIVDVPVGEEFGDGAGEGTTATASFATRPAGTDDSVCFVARTLAVHSSVELGSESAAPRVVKGAATAETSGVASADAAALASRVVRAPVARALLNVLRVAPRLSPSPSALLLALACGSLDASDVGGAAVDDDDDIFATTPAAEPATRLRTMNIAEAAAGGLLGSCGLLAQAAHVRSGALAALAATLHVHARALGAADSPGVGRAAAARRATVLRLLVAAHDDDSDIAALARTLWERHACAVDSGTSASGDSSVSPRWARDLLSLIAHPHAPTSGAAGRALATGVRAAPAAARAVLTDLLGVFTAAASPDVRAVPAATRVRAAALAALGEFAAPPSAIPADALESTFKSLLENAVGDADAAVSEAALAAGRAVLAAFSPDTVHVSVALDVLETFLAKPPAGTPPATLGGAVAWLGSAAAALAADGPRVRSALASLFNALATQSALAVQRAVAAALPHLVRLVRDAPDTPLRAQTASVLKTLFAPDTAPSNRRGAALALGAIASGVGLRALRKGHACSALLLALETAAGDSRNECSRIGAALGYEAVADALGSLFEPYATAVLPRVLDGTGDGSVSVRDAATSAGRALMKILTSQGVKSVMPAVLKGVGESSWKTKTASISLLGSMAYCAPRQLIDLLPQVVPVLVSAFLDPHPKVQAAGRAALGDVGQVIRNPELATIVPALLAAIADPAKATEPAILAIARTDFVHALDAPSLAIMVPILRRGLSERSTGLRMSATTVVSNLPRLVASPDDLMPHMSALVPILQKAVSDPIPEVRGSTGRALGALVSYMGDVRLPRVLPALREGLGNTAGTVERAGAAQALVSVLVALGITALEREIPLLTTLSEAPTFEPREGLLWVIVFLAPTLGVDRFLHHVPHLFPLALAGLADDSEVVRDTAGRATRIIVQQHSRAAADGGVGARALLPPIERAMAATSWRVRLGGVQLVGQLLTAIAGQKFAQERDAAGNTIATRPSAGATADDAADDDEFDARVDEGSASGSESDASLTLEQEEAAVAAANAKAEAAASAAAALNGKDAKKIGKEKAVSAAAATAASFLEARRTGGNKGGATKAAAVVVAPAPSWKKAAPTLHKSTPAAPVRRKKGERGRPDDEEGPPRRRKGERGHPEDKIVLSARRQAPQAKASAKPIPGKASSALENAIKAAAAVAAAHGSDDDESEWDSEDDDEEEFDDDDDDDDDYDGETSESSSTNYDSDEDPLQLTAALDAASAAHERVFGSAGRSRVLAALYLSRVDAAQVVRQAALLVWKNAVSNTPRALRDALPAILDLIIIGLSSADPERRDVCGIALGELVKKLGERVLPTLLPQLRAQLTAVGASADVRCGVCAGLTSVIGATSRSTVAAYVNLLAPPLLDALCDESDAVRAASRGAFASLYSALGGSAAVDALLPPLMKMLASTDATMAARALAGLSGIVAARPQELFPVLLPRLVEPPLTIPRVRALASTARAARAVLHRNWSTVGEALVNALAGEETPSTRRRKTDAPPPPATVVVGADADAAMAARLSGELGDAAAAVIRSLADNGVPIAVEKTSAFLSSPSAAKRRASAWLLHALIVAAPGAPPLAAAAAAATPAGSATPPPSADASAPGPDISSQVSFLLRELFARAGDPDAVARDAAWAAVSALVAGVVANAGDDPASVAASASGLLDFLRSLVSSFVSEARFRRGGIGAGAAFSIPTLATPRGLDAILPLYLKTLTAGSAETRQSAAEGLSELIDATSADGLKAYYVKIAGPLIRIVADKFPWPVKAAILGTLSKLVSRGGAVLRPFAPQLQATFTKALSETTFAVRAAGASALIGLMPLTTRVDPLAIEIAVRLGAMGVPFP